jgi:transcriptional regulator with XRE-family HTH domain
MKKKSMFGERIKALREANGFSQEFLAEQLGITQAAYSKIENNQVNLTADMVQKLAEIFKVNPGDILTNQAAVINLNSTINGQQGVSLNNNVNNYPKEFADKIINSKDEEIARLIQDKEQLKSIIDAMMKDKEQLKSIIDALMKDKTS